MAKNTAAKVKSDEVKAAEKKVKAKGIEPYKHEPVDPGAGLDAEATKPKQEIDVDMFISGIRSHLGLDAEAASEARADVDDEKMPSTQVTEEPQSAFGAFAQGQLGVDRQTTPVVKSGSSSTKPTGDTMEATKTKQEIDAEKAQAKMAAKAEKERLATEKKQAAQAEREAKIKERDAAAAARKAEREKAIAEAGEKAPRERTYLGSMLALSDRVKSGQYVKGTNGQLRSDDEVARALESVPAKKVVPLLLAVFGMTSNPYADKGLNYGQQSMNLRNKLRGAIRKGAKVGDTDVVVTLDYLKQVRDDGGYATAEAEEAATAP